MHENQVAGGKKKRKEEKEKKKSKAIQSTRGENVGED